jgi:ketosteroid isomerase-like protein
MTVQATTFNLAAYQRGFEQWDLDALLGLYAEDVQLIQVDRDNPPSAPRMRQGRHVLEGMLTHCAAAGVKATVEHAVADEHRGAATVTCEFPGGRRVVSNAMFELRDGRIVRQHDVAVGDQPAN